MTVTISSIISVVLVSGPGVTINAPVIPSFTTDDIFNVNNLTQSLTAFMATKQNVIGNNNLTASDSDLNLLSGAVNAGLTSNELLKLVSVMATSSDINRTVGATGNLQSQITALVSGKVNGAGVNLTGLTVAASQLNSFFSLVIHTTAAELNLIHGLTADANDLNVLAGTSGDFLAADLIKLGAVTATAVELSKLSGFTGASSDLNKVIGLTSSVADLNALVGLGGTGVTTTQLTFLSGLTQNVQSFLSTQPNLSGLTASANDLSILQGMAAGTGAFTGHVISSAELSYLDGVSSSIQTQLNTKMTTGGAIALSQISGVNITETEANRLSGVTSNVQTQINTLNSTSITTSGGTLVGVLKIANGSAAAPSLSFANSAGTGFYRAGADQIGIAVAGAAFGSITAAGIQWGIGTTGAPALATSAPGVSTPAYSFIGDLSTGMYRAGSDSIGFAGNGVSYMTIDGNSNGITIGGAASTNASVTLTGIFGGTKLLGATRIDCTRQHDVPVYTVPVGRTAVITSISIVATNITGAGTNPVVNFGMTGTFNEIVDGATHTNLFNTPVSIQTTGQVLPLGIGDNAFPNISGAVGASYQTLVAGRVFTSRVITATTGYGAYTVKAYAFGYEY